MAPHLNRTDQRDDKKAFKVSRSPTLESRPLLCGFHGQRERRKRVTNYLFFPYSHNGHVRGRKILARDGIGPQKGPHHRTPCVDSSLLLRDILYHVSVRTSKIVTAAALLICLLCPIAESFDQWDHTVQTGNDSEYTLVVVGLCVGVAHTFARFVLASLTAEVVSDIILHFSSHSPLAPVARSPFFIVPISLGPPALALRI